MKKNDYEFVDRAIEVIKYIEEQTDEELMIQVGQLENGSNIFVVANNEKWFFKSDEDKENEWGNTGVYSDRLKFADDFLLNNNAYLQLNKLIEMI